MKVIKAILFIIKNYTIRYVLQFLSWLHKRYADYLAEQNRHWYHVFRIGWRFRILNVKEVDSCKLTDIKYAKRVLKLKHAKIHAALDFNKHCIYTARPK